MSKLKKIFVYALCAILAVFLIWQGIFWGGECWKFYRYSQVMQMGSFGSFARQSSFKMPVLGILLRWYDYQDYVVKEDAAKRIPTDWNEWNRKWNETQPQLESFMEKTYNELKTRLDAEKADTYGGATPEETWAMFIEALKKEDFELASKYFVLEKQADYLKMFKAVKEKGQYNEMMADLTASELDEVRIWDDRSEFVIGRENEVVKATVIFYKRDNNWKIDSI